MKFSRPTPVSISDAFQRRWPGVAARFVGRTKMTDSDLNRIEQSLAITLPKEYREAMADPALVPEVEYGPGLCGDADLLIRENTTLRAQGFYGQRWDPGHFAIQEDGCGNYYFIKCPYDNTVYFADHEDNFDCTDLSNLRKWDSFYELRYC